MYDAFKAALKSCGESSKLTIHCLRHTTVTRLLESGAEGLDVARIVGHTTQLMTGRYYHPDKAHLFAVAEKVQHQFGENRKTSEIVQFAPIAKTA